MIALLCFCIATVFSVIYIYVGHATPKVVSSTAVCNNLGHELFAHTCLCHQAVQFGTGQGAATPCGWEGNRRSASHWPCVTDFDGLSTYALMV